MHKLEHHLITIQPTADVHLHAYLMTDDKRTIAHTMNRLMDIAESDGARPLPIILDTCLGDGAEIVHACLRELMPEAWETHQQADRYHLSVFTLEIGDPWDKKLMALH
jgi:hypothetical protein